MSGTKRPSRRDFLKTSAVAAGAGLAGSLGVARMAHAGGPDTIRVALIGCGGRGNGAANNCLNVPDKIQIVAVADAFEGNAKGTADRLGREFGKDKVDIAPDRVFVGLDAYQKAIDCGVDMVILATPPGFRPQQYAAAIKAGKHVFMEKPCCVDAPGFRLLQETNKLADEKNLKVGVGLQRHHQESYRRGMQELKEGKFGDIMFLRCYWNGGNIWVRRRQPDMTEMQYQVYNWYHFVWLSGDNICEQHVHNLDVCNWVMDAHPVEANGMGGCQERYLGEDKGVGQIYDHHFVEFTYANGVKMFSQCRQINNCWNNVSEAVHGTKGVSGCQSGPGGPNPYDQEHVDLVKAIRSGEKYNEGSYGATSSFTAVLGRMANYSGQVVKWDEAVEKGPSEMPERLAWDAPPRALPNAAGDYPIAMPGVYKAY